MKAPSDLTVFITGATAGFGAACARRFVREGARVIAAGRRLDRLEALRQELGPRCHTVQLDVRDTVTIDSIVSTLPDDFSSIDVLVNNAGLALGLEPAHRADWADWETMLDTNVKGLTRMTLALLPGMVERGQGHIINLGSIAGDYAYPGSNVYGATKAYVKQFSLNLRADLLGTPIRVTNIEPGLCASEFSTVRFRGDEQRAQAVYEGTDPIEPEDIAEAIFWCATLPGHVNINRLELMPVCQASGPLAIDRR